MAARLSKPHEQVALRLLPIVFSDSALTSNTKLHVRFGAVGFQILFRFSFCRNFTHYRFPARSAKPTELGLAGFACA